MKSNSRAKMFPHKRDMMGFCFCFEKFGRSNFENTSMTKYEHKNI